ncbi:MAG TPA: Lrp/AsnC ligand binding domain-containing protein [Trebonia sp.]|nr:Lrp/AsnC ligand binding domain-containing protein [Trebonia sp.]
MSAIAPSPVQAIVRVRLAPWLRCQAFEQWLRAIPAVLAAALITGEADYELRVDCPSFTDLGDVLTRVCECRGVELESTALVLHEVAGLPPRGTPVQERVTTKRPLMM